MAAAARARGAGRSWRIRGGARACPRPSAPARAAATDGTVYRLGADGELGPDPAELEEVLVAEEEAYDLDAAETVTLGQVSEFLSHLVEKTELAEVELESEGFSMFVRRGVAAPSTSAPPPPPPPAAAPAPAAASGKKGEALVNAALLVSEDDDEDEEGLIQVPSDKVGVVRRGRYNKNGKRLGKGPCVSDGDKVKKGQTVCFIEQLGTYHPVEAPQTGEVARFVVEEGGAVQFGDSILQLSPFFGGHIIGDSKHA